MSIDPTKSHGTAPVGGNRIDPSAGKQSTRQSGEVHAGGPRATRDGDQDEVRLSQEAQASGALSGQPSPSGLSPARLREVMQRLTSGFYDTAQVRDQVARRVQSESDF
jgi:hypothetical protein